MILLFLGMSDSYAQEKSTKSTVLIKVQVIGESGYIIKTVNPDNTIHESKSKNKDESSLIALKKELDKWVLEGYSLVNSTLSSSFTNVNEIIYYLVKE